MWEYYSRKDDSDWHQVDKVVYIASHGSHDTECLPAEEGGKGKREIQITHLIFNTCNSANKSHSLTLFTTTA